jgi:hypothetical protein
MSKLETAARVAGSSVGAVLVLWGAFLAADRVLLHGLAPNCSDGHPDYIAECGVTWGPGFPYLAAATLGLVLLAVSVGRAGFTRLLLLLAGGTAALLAVFLLWTGTWDPVTPAQPEPAGPQVVLLTAGLAAVLVALVLRRRAT